MLFVAICFFSFSNFQLIFPMIINVLIILTASYATYIYGIFVAVFGALSVLARPCLVDEELIQSQREDELSNGRPERHFYAGPTMMSGNSEEGDLGGTMSSSLQSLNGSEDGDLGEAITSLLD